MRVFILVGWAIFRSPNLAHLGAWFGGPGQLAVVPGAPLAVFLPLAADPYRAPDPAPGPDPEIPGRNPRPDLPWPVRGLVYLLLLLLVVSSGEQDKEFIYFQF